PRPKGWRRPSPGTGSSSPTRDRRSSRHRAASRALICEEPSAVRIANGEVGPEDPDHGTVAGRGLVDGLHDARPRRGGSLPGHHAGRARQPDGVLAVGTGLRILVAGVDDHKTHATDVLGVVERPAVTEELGDALGLRRAAELVTDLVVGRLIASPRLGKA